MLFHSNFVRSFEEAAGASWLSHRERGCALWRPARRSTAVSTRARHPPATRSPPLLKSASCGGVHTWGGTWTSKNVWLPTTLAGSNLSVFLSLSHCHYSIYYSHASMHRWPQLTSNIFSDVYAGEVRDQ